MTTHHRIPATTDLAGLTGDFDPAVSIYLATSPDPAGRQRAQTAFKAALDTAAAQVTEPAGVTAQVSRSSPTSSCGARSRGASRRS